jgi:hypothetical protein
VAGRREGARPSEQLDALPIDGTTVRRARRAQPSVREQTRHADSPPLFQRLVDESITFREQAHRSKRLMMRGALLSGVTMLAHDLKRSRTLRGRHAISR